MRLFVAIDLDHADYFSSLQAQITDPAVRLSMTRSFHLTLKFLGDVEPTNVPLIVEALRAVAVPAMTLCVDQIGVFPETGAPRVVWAGLVEDPGLHKLQREIDSALAPWFPLEKSWVAHITLARVKEVAYADDYLEKIRLIKVPSQVFEVSCFRLIHSTLSRERPAYETIASYPSNP